MAAAAAGRDGPQNGLTEMSGRMGLNTDVPGPFGPDMSVPTGPKGPDTTDVSGQRSSSALAAGPLPPSPTPNTSICNAPAQAPSRGGAQPATLAPGADWSAAQPSPPQQQRQQQGALRQSPSKRGGWFIPSEVRRKAQSAQRLARLWWEHGGCNGLEFSNHASMSLNEFEELAVRQLELVELLKPGDVVMVRNSEEEHAVGGVYVETRRGVPLFLTGRSLTPRPFVYIEYDFWDRHLFHACDPSAHRVILITIVGTFLYYFDVISDFYNVVIREDPVSARWSIAGIIIMAKCISLIEELVDFRMDANAFAEQRVRERLRMPKQQVGRRRSTSPRHCAIEAFMPLRRQEQVYRGHRDPAPGGFRLWGDTRNWHPAHCVPRRSGAYTWRVTIYPPEKRAEGMRRRAERAAAAAAAGAARTARRRLRGGGGGGAAAAMAVAVSPGRAPAQPSTPSAPSPAIPSTPSAGEGRDALDATATTFAASESHRGAGVQVGEVPQRFVRPKGAGEAFVAAHAEFGKSRWPRLVGELFYLRPMHHLYFAVRAACKGRAGGVAAWAEKMRRCRKVARMGALRELWTESAPQALYYFYLLLSYEEHREFATWVSFGSSVLSLVWGGVLTPTFDDEAAHGQDVLHFKLFAHRPVQWVFGVVELSARLIAFGVFSVATGKYSLPFVAVFWLQRFLVSSGILHLGAPDGGCGMHTDGKYAAMNAATSALRSLLFPQANCGKSPFVDWVVLICEYVVLLSVARLYLTGHVKDLSEDTRGVLVDEAIVLNYVGFGLAAVHVLFFSVAVWSCGGTTASAERSVCWCFCGKGIKAEMRQDKGFYAQCGYNELWVPWVGHWAPKRTAADAYDMADGPFASDDPEWPREAGNGPAVGEPGSPYDDDDGDYDEEEEEEWDDCDLQAESWRLEASISLAASRRIGGSVSQSGAAAINLMAAARRNASVSRAASLFRGRRNPSRARLNPSFARAGPHLRSPNLIDGHGGGGGAAADDVDLDALMLRIDDAPASSLSVTLLRMRDLGASTEEMKQEVVKLARSGKLPEAAAKHVSLASAASIPNDSATFNPPYASGAGAT